MHHSIIKTCSNLNDDDDDVIYIYISAYFCFSVVYSRVYCFVVKDSLSKVISTTTNATAIAVSVWFAVVFVCIVAENDVAVDDVCITNVRLNKCYSTLSTRLAI